MNSADAIRALSIETLLFPVLVQLVVIIVAARAFALLFRRLGQPAVVGEIAAGICLGPSLFGALFPEWQAALFHPELAGLSPELSTALLTKIYQVIQQIGLIFLLFLIGLEFDYHQLREQGLTTTLSVSGMGIIVPFAAGFGLAEILHPILEPLNDAGLPIDRLGFSLFIGVALSITAIPVLGRILIELNIIKTRVGAVTMVSAVVEDALSWIMLAAVAVASQTGFDPAMTLKMLAGTILFAAAMLLIVRPLLVKWLKRSQRINGVQFNTTAMTGIFAALFSCAIATNRIGIFAIFGAFLLGAILSDQEELKRAVNARLSDVVTAFFLPIFFTYTGLNTELGLLNTGKLWAIFAAVLIVASASKMVGCGLAARWGGFPPREAAIVGVLMNARGLTELIVIAVGRQLGLISPTVYTMLSLMAMVTTLITTPLVIRLMPGTLLEGPIRASGFLRRGQSRTSTP